MEKVNSRNIQAQKEDTIKINLPGRIVKINLAILAAYFLISVILLKANSDYALYYIIIYPTHSIINFVLGIIYAFKKDKSKYPGFFTSSLFILIIGFGACFGAIFSEI